MNSEVSIGMLENQFSADPTLTVGILDPEESIKLAQPYLGMWTINRAKDVNFEGWLQFLSVDYAKQGITATAHDSVEIMVNDQFLIIKNMATKHNLEIKLDGSSFPFSHPNGDVGWATLSWENITDTMIISAEMDSGMWTVIKRILDKDGKSFVQRTSTTYGLTLVSCSRTFEKQGT